MDILVICVAAFLASTLTLFSGFGLGTLLMPVVAVFLPVETAIAVTAMVHLANNAFKIVLLGARADRGVVLSFGIPAVACAIAGALLLGALSGAAPVHEYTVLGRPAQVTAVKLVIGLLILAFVVLDFIPAFSELSLGRKFLPLGGAVSGFFGGLSGHQGAFRSMFLLKAGLTKESFVATGVVLAVLVDLTRLAVYGAEMRATGPSLGWPLVVAATLSAFAGAFAGARLLHKVTLRSVQIVVTALLVVVAMGMMSGLL